MSEYRLYCDMDGVLVNFEHGVLNHMNEQYRLIAEDKTHPLQALALACSEEVGGLEVVLDENHIAQGLIEDDLPTNIHARAYMKALIGDNEDLWANLEWELNGKVIWNAIKDVPGLRILSAPMEEGSRLGKRIWCKRELGWEGEDVILADCKAGWGYKDNVTGILIDDRKKYINEFRAGGGLAIHHNKNKPEATLAILWGLNVI